MKKKKFLNEVKIQSGIALFSIVMVIIVIAGTSYAAFVWKGESSNSNTVTAGDYVIEIDDTSSGLGNAINLTSAYPMTDEDGKKQTPYKFTIRNRSNTDVEFSLKLQDSGTVTMDKEQIKINLSGDNKIDSAILMGLPAGELDAGILEAGSSKTYELRLWIKNNASNDAIGKTYNGKLVLDTNQIEITDNEYRKGDINMNGVIDSIDAQSASDVWIGRITFTKKQIELLDADGDGTPSQADAALIWDMVARGDYKNILENKIYSNNTVINYSSNFNSNSIDKGLFIQIGDGAISKNKMPILYFRGAVTNNYVSFAGIIWRVVRINEDGSVKLIMQDGISTTTAFNSNGSTKYKGSKIEDVLNNWYTSNIGNNPKYDGLVKKTEFCNDTSGNGRSPISRMTTSVIGSEKLRPLFTCADKNNIVNSKVGLITADEMIYAGALYEDKVTDNTTYLDNGKYFWTMTSASSTNMWYWFRDREALYQFNVGNAYTAIARPVITLVPTVTVTEGDGSESSPYVIG